MVITSEIKISFHLPEEYERMVAFQYQNKGYDKDITTNWVTCSKKVSMVTEPPKGGDDE